MRTYVAITTRGSAVFGTVTAVALVASGIGGLGFVTPALAEVSALTDGLTDALRRMHATLGADFAYNVVFNSAPRDDARPFHNWIDIVPRLGVKAGFELGTGVLVNAAAPDAAAGMLRDA